MELTGAVEPLTALVLTEIAENEVSVGSPGTLKVGLCEWMIVMSPDPTDEDAVAGNASSADTAAAHPTANAAFAGAVRITREKVLRGIGTTGATPGRD